MSQSFLCFIPSHYQNSIVLVLSSFHLYWNVKAHECLRISSCLNAKAAEPCYSTNVTSLLITILSFKVQHFRMISRTFRTTILGNLYVFKEQFPLKIMERWRSSSMLYKTISVPFLPYFFSKCCNSWSVVRVSWFSRHSCTFSRFLFGPGVSPTIFVSETDFI